MIIIVKQVLIIGYANAYFRVDYVRNMQGLGIVFDILSFEECAPEYRGLYRNVYVCRSGKGKFGALLSYLSFYFKCLQLNKYDYIHIHSVKLIESFSASLLAKKCNGIVCSIYGSDVYRVSNRVRVGLKRLFRYSKYINVNNSDVLTDFLNMFGNNFESKMKIVPFGNSHFEFIDRKRNNIKEIKKELNIPNNKIVITVGYNATKEQHHKQILNIVNQFAEELKEQIYIIIPLTYGNNVYKNEVVEYFKTLPIEGRCFYDYLLLEDVSKLRLASDIMIQLQDTDQFSGSMLEYLYADNIIITGAWLPYKQIRKYILEIESIDDLGYILRDVIKDRTKYAYLYEHAREYLVNNYSWENVRTKWLSLYDYEKI